MKINKMTIFSLILLFSFSENYFHANARQINKVDKGSTVSADENKADRFVQNNLAGQSNPSLMEMFKNDPAFFGFIITITQLRQLLYVTY